MKTLKITRFAGDPFAWNDYEIKNIKRDGSGKLIQVEVYAILWTMGSSIDTIYEIDADGNTSWATDSWTIEEEVGAKTVIYKTYSSDTSNIKGIEVHNLSKNLTATLYFNFTVVNSNNKTTYLTKTSATAVLKGNVLNSLNTYDYNNAPSVAAVRNYLESSSFIHQSDVENIVSQAVSNALLTAHPIGSIEINVSGTNPETYLGGTWEAFGVGRTLIGVGTGTDTNNTKHTFSSAELTGGEYTHKLTVTEMPSHKHDLRAPSENVAASGTGIGNEFVVSDTQGKSLPRWTVATGGNGYHNNLEPYITVYFWKRIA